jgi:hypothetical protein
MKGPRAEIIRRIVRRIEARTREIARGLRERRAEYRHARDLGIDHDALAALVRERRAGKAKTVLHRRKLAQLRRIMR